MNERAMLVQYCDDMREEINRKHSLMGIYGTEMFVNPIPSALPRFVVAVHITTPLDRPIGSMSVEIRFNDDVLQRVEPKLEGVDQSKPAPDTKGFLASMMFVLQPLLIPSEGKLRVIASIDGEELRGNALTIRQAPVPDVISE